MTDLIEPIYVVDPVIEVTGKDNYVIEVFRGEKGDQGIPGTSASGGGVRVNFGFGDASPAQVLTAIAGPIYRAEIIITTPFNGTQSSLRLGTLADPGLLMLANQNDPSAVGGYEVYPAIAQFGSPTPIYLTILLGTGVTQGAGIVVIEV